MMGGATHPHREEPRETSSAAVKTAAPQTGIPLLREPFRPQVWKQARQTVCRRRNETCASSLNTELQWGPIEDRDLSQALAWLPQRQGKDGMPLA